MEIIVGSGPIAFIFVHKKLLLLKIDNKYNYVNQTKTNPIPSKLIFILFFYELFRKLRLTYVSTPTLSCAKKINAICPHLMEIRIGSILKYLFSFITCFAEIYYLLSPRSLRLCCFATSLTMTKVLNADFRVCIKVCFVRPVRYPKSGGSSLRVSYTVTNHAGLNRFERMRSLHPSVRSTGAKGDCLFLLC